MVQVAGLAIEYVNPAFFALTGIGPDQTIGRDLADFLGSAGDQAIYADLVASARSGIDWIIVDLEHGPIDLGSAHGMITATAGTPCVPMVRIAANEPWLAKAPMDLGAKRGKN